jgi:hypothetical protein
MVSSSFPVDEDRDQGRRGHRFIFNIDGQAIPNGEDNNYRLTFNYEEQDVIPGDEEIFCEINVGPSVNAERARYLMTQIVNHNSFQQPNVHVPGSIKTIKGDVIYTITYMEPNINPDSVGIMHYSRNGEMQFISIPRNPSMSWFIQNTLPETV